MRTAAILLAIGLLAAPLPAAAQGWKPYAYPDHGFLLQFPAEPMITPGTYRTATGVTAPSVTYSATADNVVYSMMTADFSKAEASEEAIVADAVKTQVGDGLIKLDVYESINRRGGRELIVERKDGSRSTLAIFFFNQRLYILDGRALPPDAAQRANRTARFQQSLAFPVPGGRGF